MLVLKNVFFLFVVHIIRLILPLILLPLLSNRLSEESVGLYLFITGLSIWFSLFVEYGFNLSATRDIAVNNKKWRLKTIVRGVHSGKSILCIATIPLFLLLYFVIPLLQGNLNWLIYGWLSALSIGLTPLFYFQGTENTRPIAIVEIVAGSLQLLLTYFFVRQDADATLVVLFYLFSRVTVLCVTQLIMSRALGLSIYSIRLRLGVIAIRRGVHCFTLQTLAALYTSFNLVLLGVWINALGVGIYGAAERLIRAGLGFVGQASNAIFPRVTSLRKSDKKSFIKLRRVVLFIFIIAGFLSVPVSQYLGEWIVPLLFNNKFNQAIEVIDILAWVIPAIAISNVFGFQYLLADNREKLLNMVIASGGILNVILATIFVPEYGYIAMACCWVGVEWYITSCLAAIVIYKTVKNKCSPKSNGDLVNV